MHLACRRQLRRLGYNQFAVVYVAFILFYVYVTYEPQYKEVKGWEAQVDRNTSRYVRPEVDTLLVSPRIPCASKLQVVVPSSPNHFSHRAVLRATWATQQPDLGVSVVFLTGVPSNSQLQESLHKEMYEYGDIVQEDFIDTYNNLSIKTVIMLKWFTTSCPSTPLLFKADDDVFVNVTNALRLADSFNGQKEVLTGLVICKGWPVADHRNKWYCPRYMHSGNNFPPFLLGPGYIMSQEVARKLYTTALQTPVIIVEDVYLTGLVAERAGIVPTGAVGFSFYQMEVGCHPEAVVIHSFGPEELLEVWHNRHDCSFSFTYFTEKFLPWNWCFLLFNINITRWCPRLEGTHYIC